MEIPVRYRILENLCRMLKSRGREGGREGGRERKSRCNECGREREKRTPSDREGGREEAQGP